jgi:hypothetical protein
MMVIPEQGINAFAAGKNHKNAIVAITEGALNSFNRTELKLRPPLQRTCVYCSRTWCSENISTDSYRNSYWFFCNHRIGYTVANDTIIKNFLETHSP